MKTYSFWVEITANKKSFIWLIFLLKLCSNIFLAKPQGVMCLNFYFFWQTLVFRRELMQWPDIFNIHYLSYAQRVNTVHFLCIWDPFRRSHLLLSLIPLRLSLCKGREHSVIQTKSTNNCKTNSLYSLFCCKRKCWSVG